MQNRLSVEAKLVGSAGILLGTAVACSVIAAVAGTAPPLVIAAPAVLAVLLLWLRM